MRKATILLLFVMGAAVLPYCTATKKSTAASAAVTYEQNIKPIVQASCTPCHIGGKGKREPLDNYASASKQIDEVLDRIQRAPGEKGFMPLRHPKLSSDTIETFKSWKQKGLLEK
jgi:hypothetical protein